MKLAAGNPVPPGCLAAFFMSLAFAAPGRATEVPAASAISSQIAQIGPRKTIVQLERTGVWEALVTRIGQGDEAYISLVPAFAPGSDAGWSEELKIGLAQGLPKNPVAVLRLIGPDSDPIRSAKAVCGVPFIEMPKTEVEFYRSRATSAVLRVRDPSLTGQRTACLAALKLDSVPGR